MEMINNSICLKGDGVVLANNTSKPTIAIVVPCFNEIEVLPETTKMLLGKLQQLIGENIISENSKIFFIDDGSKDNTWGLIEKYCIEQGNISGIKLSRNYGQQSALLCGLFAVKDCVDAAITIDADLQDDVDIIGKMIEKYCDGYEIVYGVRSSREKDRIFKRLPALFFYRFMHFLGVDVVYNHAEFRLIGKNAINALAEYNEVNLFLRGIILQLGFKTGVEYYKRTERAAGTSKYPLRKLLGLALDAITSFSVQPIRLIMYFGILLFVASLGMLGFFIVAYFSGNTIPGWATIVCSIWGIGGLTLFSIGVIGEYIGKIYLETKRRPRFHVERKVNI